MYIQHAYREGHSTCTALTQITDDWLKYIYNKEDCGSCMVLLKAELNIIDHNLLLDKPM